MCVEKLSLKLGRVPDGFFPDTVFMCLLVKFKLKYFSIFKQHLTSNFPYKHVAKQTLKSQATLMLCEMLTFKIRESLDSGHVYCSNVCSRKHVCGL